MRPLRLQITAFGPFVSEQTIDFEQLGAHGLFLIHGPTGSGKSSILDALCFALYGDTTGGERDGSDFVSTYDPLANTQVVLDFEHLGVRYRATRYPTQMRAKLRGQGSTLRQTEANLVNLDSDEVLAAKPTDVQRQVEEMLRCKVDQFRQTVVLPQGEFRRVVTDHKARRETLARIFRTGRFADLSERLKETAARMKRQGEALMEERGRILTEAGVANVAELRERWTVAEKSLEEAAEAKRVAAGARDQALKAKIDGDALEADFVQSELLLATSQELAQRDDEMAALATTVEKAGRAAQLRGDRDHTDQRRKEHEEAVKALDGAQAALQAAAAHLETAKQAQQTLELERPAADAAEALVQRLTALKPRVDGLAEKLKRGTDAESTVRGIETELIAATEATAKLILQRDEREAERKRLLPLQDSEAEVRDALRLAQEATQAAQRLVQARADVAAIEEQILEVKADHDPLRLLGEAVGDDAPGLLAQALEDGQPCPVCGSVHHPAPAAHSDLEALQQAFEAFGHTAARLAGLIERRKNHQATITDLLGAQGWTEAEPSAAELQERLERARSREDDVAKAKARIVTILGGLDGIAKDLVTKEGQVTDLNKREAEAKAELKGIQGEIAGALEGLDEAHREPEAFEQAFTEAKQQAEGYRARFREAEQHVQKATQDELTARTNLGHAEAGLKRAAEALEQAEQTFQSRLVQAGFSDRADVESALLDETELNRRQKDLREFESSKQDVASKLAGLREKLAERTRPDLGALQDALQTAEVGVTEADERWTEADRHAQLLRRNHDHFKKLEGDHAALEQRRSAADKLSRLANGRLENRVKMTFETFVLQSILHQVLEVGNRHLRHMSAGRYSLLLREEDTASATGLELDVRDNASGGDTRPVRTLSGGEGFLASLALALGLSEIAQLQSGGMELGALFVDEGFGSLDAEALDHVIDILRTLRDEHRMVGIISHVEALKDRVPTQLRVVRGERGSRVEMALNR